MLLLYPVEELAVAVLANGPAEFGEVEAAELAAPFLPEGVTAPTGRRP